MSCSPVTISGSQDSRNPKGSPLLIANLDPVRSDCYTEPGTSILYPARFVGIDRPERATVALNLQPYLVRNPNGCSSDNVTILGLLEDAASFARDRQLGKSQASKQDWQSFGVDQASLTIVTTSTTASHGFSYATATDSPNLVSLSGLLSPAISPGPMFNGENCFR